MVGLVAHLCPDRSMFDMLNAARTEGPAAVTDAAEMLRRFNAPGGIAHDPVMVITPFTANLQLQTE